MNRQQQLRMGIVVLGLTALLFGFGNVVTEAVGNAVAEAIAVVRPPSATPESPPPPLPLRAPASLAAGDVAAGTVESAGDLVTQTFTLHAGWNTIYFEIEPRNPSPLVNQGTEDEPVWVHAQPVIEAVFDRLPCDACLESVWRWHVPFATRDYIVDPAEGLWDVPGWRYYFPQSSVGPDGGSRGFLTDMLSLRAHTGYLVKLADDLAEPLTFQVAGQPVVKHQQWVKDSYNLAGFPIAPGSHPSVAVYFGNSAVSEVRRLTDAGYWQKMAPDDTLAYGQAYLVYFDGAAAGAEGFKPPMSLDDSVPAEIGFRPGVGGDRQTIPVENTAAIPITVTISFADAGPNAPPLYYEEALSPEEAEETQLLYNYIDLRQHAVQIPLAPGEKRNLVLVLIPDEAPSARIQRMMQAGDDEDGGEHRAVLVIASLEGGTRWMIPMAYTFPDMRGLWVGDVLINDVSEARLGATNAAEGKLTIALRPRNQSGIYGAVEFQEIIEGDQARVTLQTTLDLGRGRQIVTPTIAMTGTRPYIAGYVFEDLNQNGQRGPTEPGFGGITVTLSAGGDIVAVTQTEADGAYLFTALTPGEYTLALEPSTLPDATAAFDVTPPLTDTAAPPPPPQRNAWPVQVTVDAVGITALEHEDYTGHTFAVPDLPYYDAAGRRGEPLLNFGYVSAYESALWTGTCTDLRTHRRDLSQVRNGQMTDILARASLNLPPQPELVDDHLLSDAAEYAVVITTQAGDALACGEIIVGATTVFTDGRGSEFRFRLLLDLQEEAPGRVALLPGYTSADGTRISSVAFSMPEPVLSSGSFTDSLRFAITIDYQDPLSPYKHKYHPDHDNLDAQFNPIDIDAVPPHLWEVYTIRRDIELEFTDLPPIDAVPGAMTDTLRLAQEVGWGGAMWGGYYREVIRGLHKHDITVRGIFIVRHILPPEKMTPQPWD